MKLNILCIGDVVGRPGRRILSEHLRDIVKQHSIDCAIVNAENAAGGSGLTPQIYDKLLKYGVNLITLGDHTYRKRDIIPTLEKADDIVKPANLGAYSAGKGYALFKTSKGPVIAVAVLIGRIFMKPADSPYSMIDTILPEIKRQADVVFVEVHAEATSEKVAMGHYLDGKVSCVYGTHTHIPTADEKILPGATAYITDIGMTGSHDSVLGRNKQSVIKSLRTQMPYNFEIATEDVRIDGIVVSVDSNTKSAERIERVQISEDGSDDIGYDSDDGRAEYIEGFH